MKIRHATALLPLILLVGCALNGENQIRNYKWANIEKCTKSVADRTLFTDIKLLYTFYCPYTADSIVQFFKFAHL